MPSPLGFSGSLRDMALRPNGGGRALVALNRRLEIVGPLTQSCSGTSPNFFPPCVRWLENFRLHEVFSLTTHPPALLFRPATSSLAGRPGIFLRFPRASDLFVPGSFSVGNRQLCNYRVIRMVDCRRRYKGQTKRNRGNFGETSAIAKLAK
ncbi:hypothetical protein B0H12DRAFT_678539 [Mycena haematopus]|nr:hypothetical protein B0H12DRAFT_678539 [Mycena haematopus]